MLRAIRWLPWVTHTALAAEAAGRPDLAGIHAEHVDFVWATLQRLGVRAADLEDLTQEVFVVIHQRLHTFEPGQPLPPWIFGICRRMAAAHRRRSYVRREQPSGAFAEEIEEEEGAAPTTLSRCGRRGRGSRISWTRSTRTSGPCS